MIGIDLRAKTQRKWSMITTQAGGISVDCMIVCRRGAFSISMGIRRPLIKMLAQLILLILSEY